MRERGENDALQVASVMQAATVVDLTAALAIGSARHRLPLADSIIYATTILHRATLWTQDEHFKGLTHVQ